MRDEGKEIEHHNFTRSRGSEEPNVGDWTYGMVFGGAWPAQ